MQDILVVRLLVVPISRFCQTERGGLNGLVSLVQKCKPYIKRDKAETEKDPSASLPASDGSNDDCTSNQ